ncbi:MAG: protein kinase, partial [Thermodesulfovibrio sp.]|nr:protein kinase [Thermodesulfovibrio sp.]
MPKERGKEKGEKTEIERGITYREEDVLLRREIGKEVGREFKGYEVVEELDLKGAEADYYLLRKEDNLYFLKLYRKGYKPKDVEKIVELSRKFPEHIVKIEEYGEYEGRLYEIQEYVKYSNLKDFVRKYGIEGERFREVVKEMVECLSVLHRNGVIHRDIKPQNILVREKEPLDLILTDFGISSIMEEDVSKVLTGLKGTFLYSAPEVFSGYFGKESDYWSLGIVLLEVIYGKHPYIEVPNEVY